MRLKSHLILMLIASSGIVLMGATSCQVGDAPKFEWSPKLFAADSKTRSIVRKNGDAIEQIRCDDSRFDDYIAIHKSEPGKAYKAYTKVVNACAEWKAGAAQVLEEADATMENIETEFNRAELLKSQVYE